MTEQMEKWIESWWENPERPNAPAAKQVWTIFETADDSEREGAVVCVLSCEEDRVEVMPAHSDLALKTGLSVLLEEADLSFSGELMADPPQTISITASAFKKARYLGEFTPSAHEKLTRAYAEFSEAQKEIERIRDMESRFGPEGILNEDLDKALAAGVFKLAPVGVSVDEMESARAIFSRNLAPFHAPPKSLPEKTPGAANIASFQVLYDPSLDMNMPADFYKSIAAFLDRFLPEIKNRIQSKVAANQSESVGQVHEEDLNMLGALVYAKLEMWSDSALAFERLIGSAQNNAGMRGVVWLKENLNQGDDKKVLDSAIKIAGSDNREEADRIMSEARVEPLEKFLQVESIEDEIDHIWTRVKAAVKEKERS